jgi:L-ascorbate metabolism protein UlaG (beta-lactamase superfamily)
VKVTSLGHACLRVEVGGAQVLIDPGVFSPGFEEQSGLDAVLITHQHADHLDPQRIGALIAGNPSATVLCEAACVEILAGLGVEGTALAQGQTYDLGGVTVTGVGSTHAEIYREIPRIGNVGMLLRADGEPSLLHPGDSYARAPEGVDLLAVPLSAPWSALKETIDFVRAVSPGRLFPVHDGTLSAPGRGMYVGQLSAFLPPGAALQDLAGAGAVTL